MKTNLKKCNLTTAACLDEWFAQYVIPKTRANTQTCYKRFIDVINDYLGEIPLSELTSSDIQQMVFDKYRNNFRSAQLLKVVLTIAINKAIARGLIEQNPVNDVALPDRDKGYIFSNMNDADWEKLISAKPECFYWSMLFALEYSTGMRRSELLGLKWKDIDTKTGRLNICRALIIGAKNPVTGKRELVLAGTKTINSTRNLYIPHSICEMLDKYKNVQSKNLNKAGLAIDCKERFVFCHPDGRPIHPSTFSSLYVKVRRKLNINTTFHMLRHDLASRMKKSHRFDFKDIQMQLGHSSIRTTLDIYTHIDDSDKKEVSIWLEEGINLLIEHTK